MAKQKKKWNEYIPHPLVMLFGIIVLVTALSYLLPAGSFDRELVDGRQRVIPGTFKYLPQSPLSFLDMFVAFAEGFKAASDIIWVVLTSGIMFGVLQKSKMIEHAVGTIVKQLGLKRKYIIVILMTFVFGMLGVGVGYENNIALVPIGAILALAIGGDLVLAVGISVAAITIGFGLSPINPYTIGTGHKIAELPMFSGALLRSVLCFSAIGMLAYYNVRYFKKIEANPDKSLGKGLNTEGFTLSKKLEDYSMSLNNWLVALVFLGGMTVMLYGIFNFGWYLKEISAMFIIMAIGSGIVARLTPKEISEATLKSVSLVAPGAFMVGIATTIKVILEKGTISDTIAYHLSEVLLSLPIYASAILMSIAQCIMNLIIPSGSGQALATLPVMIPIGDIVGISRQVTILAFQIGDGVTNLMNPTLGGLIAMLSMARMPFDRWLRFIAPLAFIILVVCWVFLVISVLIGYN